jgi:NAD(P)-dependent dehydrogenase (short-subunit alcohol dehydrogenase family)
MWRAMIGQGAKSLHCPEEPRLDGRIALVTGATGGIGAEIVRGLVRRGAEVILPCRSEARGRATLESLRAEFGAASRAHLAGLDLEDLTTIAAAMCEIADACSGRTIDLLVENAGIWPTRYRQSAQGHEIAFAVNVLAHFALRKRLMDAGLLPAARVIVLTGDIYVMASECTADYRWKGPWGGTLAYCRSKLGNIWIAAELARRHPELEVFVVHPGVIATNLGGDAGAFGNAIKRQVMISPQQGAQTALLCATQDGLQRGGYYHNTQGVVRLPPTDPGANRAAAEALWSICENLAGTA